MVVSLFGAFLAAAVIAGFLGAGLFIPAVGALGASARTAVDLFESLPDELIQTPLSEQSVILDSKGATIATPYDENRIIVPLSEIAPIMRQAQVAIEDHRFYDHGGADLQGILRSFVSNKAAGEVTGGGSTLTQQYVKVTLQESALRAGDKKGAAAATAQTYGRKVQELKYAIALEKTLTKDQILQGYLNLVYYGDRAYGVEAAAQHYFSHGAKTLSLTESALLAGIVQNPGNSDPINYPEKALSRRNVVLDRMHELTLITDADWKAAKAVPLKDLLKVKTPQNSCALSPYPYFCDYVINWLKLDPSLDQALGATDAARRQSIYRGGLTIQTTLDPAMMSAAREELVKKVPVGSAAGDGAYIGAATAIVDTKTGAVKAFAQNTDYAIKPTSASQTSVNWAVDTKYGGSLGFMFGSTAKAATLVAALEAGMPTSASVYTKAGSSSNPASYTKQEIVGRCGVGGKPWEVRNVESVAAGTMKVSEATAESINTAFVGMVIQYLGGDPCKVLEVDTRIGLMQASGEPLQPYPAAILLGSNNVSPLTVASAYQTLANDGKHCPARPVIAILKNGKPLPVPPLGSQCEQRVDPDVARGATQLLTNVFQPGKGTGRKSILAGDRPAAGKSGTTNNNNETWFVGYTPDVSTAVWIGTPNDKNNLSRLENVRVGGVYYPTMYSSWVAGPTWKAIMDRALAGVPNTPFTDPSTRIAEGEKVDIPDVNRMSVDDARAALQAVGFSVNVVRIYSGYRSGVVIGTNPRNTATRGSAVVLYVSRGPNPNPPAPTTPVAPAPPPPG